MSHGYTNTQVANNKSQGVQKLIIGAFFATLCFVAFAPNSASAALVRPPNNLGLVGYWSLDDGAGSTAIDFSGNGNTGTLKNFSLSGSTSNWVTGKRSRALDFDGNDDYVQLPNSVVSQISGGTQMSATYWFKGTLVQSAVRLQANDNDFIVVGWGTVTPKVIISTDGSTNGVAIAGVQDGQWHHVAFTWQKNTTNGFKVYVDGAISAQRDSANVDLPTLTSFTKEINLGHYAGTAEAMVGSLDDVRVYSRALSAAEVSKLYQSGATRLNTSQNSRLTNGLVGLWSFDGKDVNGTTTYDRSGNGNNGVLTNGPAVAVGKIGQALNFDGADDYVAVASNGAFDNLWATGGTASYWVKPRTGGEANAGFSLSIGSSWSLFNNAVANSPGLEFNVKWSGGIAKWRNSTPLPFPIAYNTWNHVTVVYDGSSAANDPTFYLNGISYGSMNEIVSPSGTISSVSNGSLYIGSNSVTSRATDQFMDEVRLYNRAFSATEVMELYRLGSANVNRSMAGAPGASNLVLWHTFDGTKLNTTTSTDSSASAIDGALTGATGAQNKPQPTTGKVGQALKFDGTDDRINFAANTADITGPLSVAAWVKTASSTQTLQTIVDRGGPCAGSTTSLQYVLCIHFSRSIRFTVGDATGSVAAATPADLNSDTWYHVVGTFDGSNVQIYLNGALSGGPTATSFSTLQSASGFSIGESSGSQRRWNGSIDDVRIYDRALTATEILQLYNATK